MFWFVLLVQQLIKSVLSLLAISTQFVTFGQVNLLTANWQSLLVSLLFLLLMLMLYIVVRVKGLSVKWERECTWD